MLKLNLKLPRVSRLTQIPGQCQCICTVPTALSLKASSSSHIITELNINIKNHGNSRSIPSNKLSWHSGSAVPVMTAQLCICSLNQSTTCKTQAQGHKFKQQRLTFCFCEESRMSSVSPVLASNVLLLMLLATLSSSSSSSSSSLCISTASPSLSDATLHSCKQKQRTSYMSCFSNIKCYTTAWHKSGLTTHINLFRLSPDFSRQVALS